MSVSVCLSLFLSTIIKNYLRNYTSDLHHIVVHVTYGRGSAFSGGVVISYVLPVFMDDVIFARKPRLLDLAAQLKRGAHAAFGLAINYAE